MTRHVSLAACLVAILFTGTAFSQSATTEPNARISAAVTSSPVAYVYVLSSPSSNKNVINAYSAASNGKLTPLAGSPFSAADGYGGSMAINGTNLFATNEVQIISYSIAATGTLHRSASIDAQRFNQSDCGGPIYLFLDRTGATLYDEDIYNDCANNAYQFFALEGTAGGLNYRGVTANSTPEFYVPLSFTGNNDYAYGASCYHWNQMIFGFARGSDGALTSLAINPPMPAEKAADFYCPYLTAADSANHVAVAVQPINNSSLQSAGSYQLATYTADSSGNLSTNSRYSNMPTVAVGDVADIAMSPSGKLLAVAGSSGLQVFHFNCNSQITHYTGVLTTDAVAQVDQLFWDNANHLYAISQSAGKLSVFTVTATSYSQAAGSPYTITNPGSIAVLGK